MMEKKWIASLMGMTLAAAALAGCASASGTGSAQPAAEQQESSAPAENDTASAEAVVSGATTLTFIFADGDEGAKSSIQQIVSDFNASHPDITVNIEPGNGGAYSEFLKTKDSVGEFPDVMEMRDTAMYVRAGKLEPFGDELKDLFLTTTEFDGEVYTAPLSGENTDGIIYNKSYFEENGFEEPETYDDFIALCQAIADKGDMAPLVVGGQDIWHLGFWFNKAYDDQVISVDEDFIANCYAGTKDFNDPAFRATFEEMADIMQYAQDGWTSTPDAQITTFLVNDMAAMMFSGTHMFSQIQAADPDFEYGWFAVPSPDGQTRLVGGAGVGGLAISAESAKDPDKKAAAEEFIKFFFAPENYKLYCETLSFIPTTVDQPEMDVDDVFQKVIDATTTADHLSPMWNGKSGENELPPDFRNFTYKTCIEYLQGPQDLDTALDEINKTWQTAAQSFNPVTGVGIE